MSSEAPTRHGPSLVDETPGAPRPRVQERSAAEQVLEERGNTADRRQGRSTSQRAAMTGLLEELDQFRSAQDLHAQLMDRGVRISLTTVYRTLAALAADEAVDTVLMANGEALYRKCSRGHHHHLVCRSCGRTVEVRGDGIEAWSARIAAEHGFSNASHVVEVFGDCSSCG